MSDLPIDDIAPSSQALPISRPSSSKSSKKPSRLRSCDGCRIRKIACSYRVEGQPPVKPEEDAPHGNTNGQTAPRPPCKGCAAKGIPCIISNEHVPFTRNRSGKNVRMAIAHAQAAVDVKPVLAPEQPLVDAAISGRLGRMLLEAAVGPNAVENRPPLIRPMVARWMLTERFDQVSGRVSELSPQDQVLATTLFAFGTRKIADQFLGSFSRNDAFEVLAKRAQLLADQHGLWRTPDVRSINLLVLLAGVLSDGQLESRPWLRYYKAAIASLEDLPAPPTLEEEVNAYDCYASILAYDSTCAAQADRHPALPQSLINRFSRAKALPATINLHDPTLHPAQASIAIIQTIERASLILRKVALFNVACVSQPAHIGGPLHALAQAELDALHIWLSSPSSLPATDYLVALSHDIIWSVLLAGELQLTRACERCASLPFLEAETRAKVAEASKYAWTRVQDVLISFSEANLNQRKDRHPLALMTGTCWSISALLGLREALGRGASTPTTVLSWVEQGVRNVNEAYALATEELSFHIQPHLDTLPPLPNRVHIPPPSQAPQDGAVDFDTKAADALINWLEVQACSPNASLTSDSGFFGQSALA